MKFFLIRDGGHGDETTAQKTQMEAARRTNRTERMYRVSQPPNFPPLPAFLEKILCGWRRNLVRGWVQLTVYPGFPVEGQPRSSLQNLVEVHGDGAKDMENQGETRKNPQKPAC